MGLAALQIESLAQRRRVSAEAPGKINLLLDILGPRPDGYHDIHSLAVGVGLSDRLTCTWPSRHGLTLECSDPTLHVDFNLASRAALALAQRKGIDAQVEIRLDKNIPVGAGMGGGSSDAAAALRLCDEIWNTRCSDAELVEVGAELGSDVPLFFHLPAVEVSGRGECVEPFPLKWRGFALLIFAGFHVSTSDVYKAWRPEDSAGDHAGTFSELHTIARADHLHDRLRNQMEPALSRVCPRVRQAQEALSTLGLPPTRVTGSGSAMFRLFDDPDQAHHAAKRIRENLKELQVAVVPCPVDTFAIAHTFAPTHKES